MIWNRLPFTCPGCGQRFAEATTQISKLREEWMCSGCVNNRALYQVTRLAPADVGTCATCRKPIAEGHRVVDPKGRVVHGNGLSCPNQRSRHRRRSR